MAKYPGTCSECGEDFATGDPIRYQAMTPGARVQFLVHDDCDDAPEPQPDPPACDVCWLVHPEGACDR